MSLNELAIRTRNLLEILLQLIFLLFLHLEILFTDRHFFSFSVRLLLFLLRFLNRMNFFLYDRLSSPLLLGFLDGGLLRLAAVLGHELSLGLRDPVQLGRHVEAVSGAFVSSQTGAGGYELVV